MGARFSDGTTRRRVLQTAAGVGIASVTGIGSARSERLQPANEQRWVFDAGSAVRSSPSVVDGTVYIGTDSGSIYALDAATGRTEWEFLARRPIESSPTVVDGTVYVTEGASTVDTVTYVYALDASNGREQWRFETTGDISSPTVVDGTVYVGNIDAIGGGTVYALNAGDGTERWAVDIGSEVASSPTVADDTVYVGSLDGTVHALDADTGDRNWSVTAEGSQWASPTVSDGTVYIATNGTVHALDGADGTEQWSFEIGASIESSPTVAGETVYIGSGTDIPGQEPEDTSLYAIDLRDGTERWSFETGGVIESSPTVAGETVYVGSNDARIYALGVGDGTERWAVEADAPVRSSPTVHGGTVYVGSDGESVYALDTGTDASSVDSRVVLGTLGHHDGWRYAEQSISVVARALRTQQQLVVAGGGLVTLLGVASVLRPGAFGGTASLGKRVSFGRGVLLIVGGALLSTVSLGALPPPGEYTLWRLAITPILVRALVGGPSPDPLAASVLIGWLLLPIGFALDYRRLRAAEVKRRLSRSAPAVESSPARGYGIISAFPLAGFLLDATVLSSAEQSLLGWVVVAPFAPLLVVAYLRHRSRALGSSSAAPASGSASDGSESSEESDSTVIDIPPLLEFVTPSAGADTPGKSPTMPEVSFEVIDELAGRTYRKADRVVARKIPGRSGVNRSSYSEEEVTVDLTAGTGEVELGYGTWTFEVEEDSRTVGTRKHDIEGGFDSDHIALSVDPYVVDVQVTEGPERTATERAEVTATADVDEWSSRERTDSEGTVRFEVPRSASTVTFTVERERLPPVESEYRVDRAREDGVTLSVTSGTGNLAIETRVGDREWPGVEVQITPVSEDAEVHTDEGTITTGAEGRREVENLPVGEYEVSADPRSEKVNTTAAVESVTVEADATTEVTLSVGASYSLSTAQRERIADLRDRIDGLSDASGRDTVIPRYYGTVLVSVLDLIGAIESNPEQLGADAPPDATVEALLDAVDAGITVVDDAMSERRNVELFEACESLPPATVDWSGTATLDALAERKEKATDSESAVAGWAVLDERLAETDELLQRKWSEVAVTAPARKLHDRIKEWQREFDDDDALRVATHAYVAECLLDAVEGLFDHDALRERLDSITY